MRTCRSPPTAFASVSDPAPWGPRATACGVPSTETRSEPAAPNVHGISMRSVSAGGRGMRRSWARVRRDDGDPALVAPGGVPPCDRSERRGTDVAEPGDARRGGAEGAEAVAQVGVVAVHDQRLAQERAQHEVVQAAGQRVARQHRQAPARHLRRQPAAQAPAAPIRECVPRERPRRGQPEVPAPEERVQHRGAAAAVAAGTSRARRGCRRAPRTGSPGRSRPRPFARPPPGRAAARAHGAHGRCRARRATAAPGTSGTRRPRRAPAAAGRAGPWPPRRGSRARGRRGRGHQSARTRRRHRARSGRRSRSRRGAARTAQRRRARPAGRSGRAAGATRTGPRGDGRAGTRPRRAPPAPRRPSRGRRCASRSAARPPSPGRARRPQPEPGCGRARSAAGRAGRGAAPGRVRARRQTRRRAPTAAAPPRARGSEPRMSCGRAPPGNTISALAPAKRPSSVPVNRTG